MVNSPNPKTPENAAHTEPVSICPITATDLLGDSWSRIPAQPPPREPRPAPEEAIAEALDIAQPRVALMIRLCATLGLRIGEIVLIHRGDVEQEVTGPVLRVHGKGNKKRTVPISPEFASELLEWCERGDGWAFPSQRGDHLRPHSASAILSAALRGKWTAHTLRHRFATMAYEVDRGILTVQRLLGHASVATTMRYAKPPREALVRAVHGASFKDGPSSAIFVDFRGSDVSVAPRDCDYCRRMAPHTHCSSKRSFFTLSPSK